MEHDLDAASAAVIEHGLKWLDNHEGELIGILEGLVGRPSVTGDEGAVGQKETAVGFLYSELADMLETAQLDRQSVDAGPKPRDNCYAVLPGDGNEVFINTSHTDTVPAGDPHDWPGNDPYTPQSGTVRYVGDQTIELSVGATTQQYPIRQAYDRVWQEREEETRTVRIGRGAYDNKAAIVSLVGALRALEVGLQQTDRSLGGTLIHGHLVGEEVSQTGAKAMAGQSDHTGWMQSYEDEPTGALVVMEGSYGFVPVVGHRGLAWVRLNASGKSAHAATPHLGENAVLETAKAIASTDSQSFYDRLTSPFRADELLGELTVATGTTIIGGDVKRDDRGEITREGINAVPDWCETTFDVRIPRWQDHPEGGESIREHIETTVEKQANAVSTTVSFEAHINSQEFFPPVAIADTIQEARDHPLVQRARTTTRSQCGITPEVAIAPGVTDAASLYPVLKIPTLIEYGPAGALSHEPYEFVEVESMLRGAAVMLELSVRQLGVR